MRILFIHNNFPAQFGRLGQYLARQGWEVHFATQAAKVNLAGITVHQYGKPQFKERRTHPYAINYENAVVTGQAMTRLALQLKQNGLEPDIIMAHSGWGPGLFVKEVWPQAKYIGYYEWYYQGLAIDTMFLNNAEPNPDQRLRAVSRNGAIVMDMIQSDISLCPTRFQADQFPASLRDQLTVIHDGIDTEYFSPDESTTFNHEDKTYTVQDEIITYVARGMEPYRGFPQFMAALATLQKQRPNLQAIIVGNDRVAYGAQLPEGQSYKKQALEELDLDLNRICFTGLLPYEEYRKVLRISSAHVYLTIPFVLSWSMMEAMSTGCLLVASDTEPVRELITDQENGILVPFHDQQPLIEKLNQILDDPQAFTALRQKARETILSTYKVEEIFKQKEQMLRDLLAQ
jgi:glycosyltransferase involved in cell wall biosynthesis